MLQIDKNKIWIFLRIVAIICLILSLFNIEINSRNRETSTIFLVDRSLSTAQYEEEIKSYIDSQVQKKNKKDTFGIVSFGRNAMIDTPISKEIENIDLNTNIDSNFTNIEVGIRTALDLFPKDANKRLVIFTDAIENIGSYKDIAHRIQEEKVNVHVYPLYLNRGKDAELSSIIIPSKAHADLPVDVEVYSNFKSDGMLYLYMDDEKILEEKIEIGKGSNTFKYSIPLGDKIGEKLKGEINIFGDTNSYNNTFTTEIGKKHRPKILVIGKEEDRKNIENVLSSFDVDVKSHTAKEVPSSLDYLGYFEEIILVNTSHDDINRELEENISYCIKEEGIGLLVVGGDETFSLGGYKDTLLEEMLPVSSHIKGDEKKPNSGIVLAIDSSGSMADESGGVKKIEMAKQAAISSIEALEEDDFVGVLGFSDILEWIVPYGKVGNKEDIESEVEKLKAKGGTLILPSIEEGLKELSDSSTKINHIILLTDGEGEKEGYERILGKLNEKNITLSTVAIGKDSDVEFLKLLSKKAGGRNYYVEDVDTIPKIFAKETYIASRKYINERKFIPEVENTLFQGISFPNLDGYVSTSLKEDGKLILKTDLDEPLLAEGRYGLGKVMVWTSDLNGKWSRDFVGWSGFQDAIGRIVDCPLAEKNDDGIDIDILQRGSKVDVFVNTRGKGKNVKMILTNPEKKEKEYPMNQIEKNKFKGEIYLDHIGSYILKFEIEGEDGKIHRYSRFLYLDYSPEYALKNEEDNDRLEFLNTFKTINKEDSVFNLPLDYKSYSNRNLNHILLPLALFSFICDLWMRKRNRRY